MLQSTRIIGVPLEEAAALSDLEYGAVPSPIRKAVNYLNKKGLDEEGLYRVSGSEVTWQVYLEKFNSGEDVNIDNELLIENVTMIVIKYLKALPESIFTNEYHPQFKIALDIQDNLEKKEKIKALFMSLPFPNRETIHLLASHFQLISKHSEKNLMDANNIQTILLITLGATNAKVFTLMIEDLSICPSTIIFGIPVERAAAISDPARLIPSPIRLCVDYIETNNKWEADLYVASGSWILINKFKEKFNRGEKISFEDVWDVDVITGIIKLYIHDIPENLFTHQLKQQVMNVAEMKEEEQVPALQSLIQKLPECNKVTLELLIRHLKRVCDNSNGEIKPGHLGAVFGGSYKVTFPMVINHCDALFPKK